MSRIKICGLSREEDVEYANICLPDYIGFVFAESRRRIDAEKAAALKSRLNPCVKAVGVFVNEEPAKIKALCDARITDLIQLHGDEDEAYILSLKSMIMQPVIKAVAAEASMGETSSAADYLLFDTGGTGLRGGSGRTFSWEIVRDVKKPYFLAGGLNAGNIAEALRMLDPFCIDVSSGVETGGRKDFEKMRVIVRAVRAADRLQR
ncbi:MAG: phosphoribosylanthranilate isomerase [Clostridiales Family XIII bacterium]|jgi:phosphoribosylanthranilate isomerase|nr:phosphoribosylanthranilate isomerase [Clostridiales Family XIII bacterium]